jgi:hypothetical protein
VSSPALCIAMASIGKKKIQFHAVDWKIQFYTIGFGLLEFHYHIEDLMIQQGM